MDTIIPLSRLYASKYILLPIKPKQGGGFDSESDDESTTGDLEHLRNIGDSITVRRKGLGLLIGVILLGIVAISFLVFAIGKYTLVSQSKNLNTQKENIRTFDKFHLTGVLYSHYDENGKKLFTIESEEITHKKRKVGSLTIGPLKEIEMIKVRIEIDQEKENSQKSRKKSQNAQYISTPEKQHDIFPLSVPNMLKEIIQPQDLGFVSRVVIHNMDFVFLRMGQQHFTISANRVTFAFTSQEVVFQDGFSLTSQSGKQLAARKAEWLHGKKLFFIPGTYTLKDEQGTHFGTRAFFTVDTSGKIKKVEELTVRGKVSTTE